MLFDSLPPVRKGEGPSFFSVGVFICPPPSPHSPSFSCFASPSLRLLNIHSLFKHGRLLRAAGDEVPAHLRQAHFSLQLFPHLGHRQLHVAASLRPSGQAREDKRLVSREQQPLRVDPGEAKPTAELLLVLLLKGLRFDLDAAPRLIWRRRSASAASSLRGPKTSAWCSLCPFSRLRTVTTGSRGIR